MSWWLLYLWVRWSSTPCMQSFIVTVCILEIRRIWNWLGHTHWEEATTALPNRNRERPKNTWKRDLEKEMGTAGFKYSWKKMEAAAQDRAGWRQVVYGTGLASATATRHKSSKWRILASNTKIISQLGKLLVVIIRRHNVLKNLKVRTIQTIRGQPVPTIFHQSALGGRSPSVEWIIGDLIPQPDPSDPHRSGLAGCQTIIVLVGDANRPRGCTPGWALSSRVQCPAQPDVILSAHAWTPAYNWKNIDALA